MKRFFRNIHLYLSLAAGLIIMTCCFSGAILVFEKELQEALHHDRYFVKKESLQLPIETIIHNVKAKYPAAKIASVKVYSDPTRSVEVSASLSSKGKEEPSSEQTNFQSAEEKSSKKPGIQFAGEQTGKSKQGASSASGTRPTHTIFVNPYTGHVIELYNYRETFFYTMFSLHRWLLGNESSIGKTITGVATFVFLFILITGIILWWPRNKAILKQRLKIKTDASFKRLNHDLHIVLGFYSAIFLFIFAFTALAWSFKWFNDGIYTITKSSMKAAEPPHSHYQAEKKVISYDKALAAVSKVAGDVQYVSLRAPNDSTGIFTATVLPSGAHETAADNYYIDQYSGQLISTLKFRDKNTGQRIRSTFKPVHVGSIYGLPSKIVAFLVCVLGVTFPVTGTIMWINRLRKKKVKQATGGLRKAVPAEDYLD
ncbi:MAG TPA: PepSY-associated TM helix domain-containing protein [Segetibacter sp.]|nr:PepSY-associated TM helix domain-containing protein [Segetibacter sp.]